MEYRNNEGFVKTAKSRTQTLSSRSGQHVSWEPERSQNHHNDLKKKKDSRNIRLEKQETQVRFLLKKKKLQKSQITQYLLNQL